MKAQQVLFLLIATMIFLGIYLTGFGVAHWLLYVVAGVLTFAGVTGICPGIMLLKKLGLK